MEPWKKIAVFLKATGISQGQMARDIGLSKGTLSHYKSRRTRPMYTVRVAIEQWSRGRIKASDWLLESEVNAITDVKPLPLEVAEKADSWLQGGSDLPAGPELEEGEEMRVGAEAS